MNNSNTTYDHNNSLSPDGKHNIFFQRKLVINNPNDQYEKEADAVADKVMRMETPSIQTKVDNNLPAPIVIHPIQRKCAQCEEEEKKSDSYRMQRKKMNDEATTADDNLESYVESLDSRGDSLPNEVRNFYEPRFGYDFSNVKVHTDSVAAKSAQSIHALAYTSGNNIVFNNGRFDPNTDSGKRLLGHELTHAVQQDVIRTKYIQRRGIGDHHDLSSPRFAGNPALEDAYDHNTGGVVIRKRAHGAHVRLIQQALIDAGFPLTRFGVDGDFGDETKQAVQRFQASQGLTGGEVDGEVGTVTMGLFDSFFQNHATMASIPQSQVPSTRPTQGVSWAAGTAPPGLTTGTRPLTSAERAEIERRRTTEVQAPSGSTTLPVFHMNIPGNPDSYETRVERETNRIITRLFNGLARGRRAQRTAAGGLHGWAVIEHVADISKRETDRVFGNFAVGIPLRAGVNLFDAWQRRQQDYAAGGAGFEQQRVEWRVNKVFSGPEIHTIDIEHGAVQSRTPGEQDTLTAIRNRIIAARRAELIEIDLGWPGFADSSTRSVFIQRFTAPDAAGNRNFMWRQFQVLVHEYIHTLAHPHYRAYYDSLPEMRGGKTYREGMTDYFTKIVLDSTVYNDALRTDVEGSFHDTAITHPIASYRGYEEAANAEAVVGVAGIRNAMAAYFLGRVDLIGGP